MTLPYILVLDDLWFWSREQRERVCRRLGLFDSTDGVSPEDPEEYVAIAEFQSGQARQGNEIVNDLNLALRQIESRWHADVDHRWALVLLDLQFDRGLVSDGELNPNTNWPRDAEPDFGLRILKAMIERWPDRQLGEGNSEIPVVVLSQFEHAERGAAASRAGALRYVEKRSLDRRLLGELLDQMGLIEDPERRILGHSPALLKTLRRAREVARSAKGNVLILGEMGSGKTSLADYIHKKSPRCGRPLQHFTVSEGMDATLLKSQLYGFWYGAYTPADRNEAGLAERAHLGTLFLDEIGSLPPAAQSELLGFSRLSPDGLRNLSRLGSFPTASSAATRQALESVIGELNRETQRIAVDVFLITATNKPLDDPEYVRQAGFLPDLLTRLGQEYFSPITFPRMADRREDVILLFREFLRQASETNHGAWPKALDAEVVSRLEAYSWPGNVAEIQGVAREVERASRHWQEVNERQLGKFDGLTVKTAVPIPDLTQVSSPEVQTKAGGERDASERPAELHDALQMMRSVRLVGLRSELDGALPALHEACGDVVVQLVYAALEYTRNVSSPDGEAAKKKSKELGDLNPTKAMKLLLRRPDLSTSEAQDEIKRLFARIGSLPDPASTVGRVLAWARGGRQGTR